jgi:hypothetical protein
MLNKTMRSITILPILISKQEKVDVSTQLWEVIVAREIQEVLDITCDG